jgi:hypothetical protein
MSDVACAKCGRQHDDGNWLICDKCADPDGPELRDMYSSAARSSIAS